MNLSSRMAFAIVILFVSLGVKAATVGDFFTVPEGVSVLVKNNSSFPWMINDKGALVSDMHKDYRSSYITYTNNSSVDLCCQFEWAVSSESNCDNLSFSCNGSYSQSISGSMYYRGSLFYQPIFCYLKAGQSLIFNYSKDGSGSSGDDCGYVRNLTFSLPQEDDTELEWGFSLTPLSSSKSASIIAYYGKDGDVVVPSVIKRGGVNYIPDYIEYDAFRENGVLTSLTMQDGIEEIGANAFKDCPNLESVIMPNTVTGIDPQAFQGCKSLRSVTLSNRVPALKQFVFDGCERLENITIPTSVKSIGNYTFRDCRALKSVDIPNSVTLLDNFAFDGCSGLESVFIPSSLTTINDNVFTSCKSLERIEVAEGNPNFDSRNGCNAIIIKNSNVLMTGCKNTVIPNNVVGIGTNAFYGSSEMEYINIPTSVRGVGLGAFQDCKSIKRIDMPSVEMIGAYAFYGCENLRSVKFSENLMDIAHAAFYGCSSLQSLNLPQSVEMIDEAAFEYCRSLSSVILPVKVTSLLADVFAYCEKLKYLVVEGELTEVVNSAFRHCGKLSSVVINNRSLVNVTSNRSFDAGYVSDHITPFSNCTLFVPKGSEEAYRSATGWKQFGSVNTIAEQADYGLFVSKEGCGHAGHQMALQVEMNNVGPVSLWQADVVLPDGFTLANVEDAIKLNEDRTEDTDISVRYNVLEDGTVRIVASSRTGNAFVGSEGIVASLVIEAPYDAKPGDYFAEFRDVNFIDPMKQSFGVSKYISKFSIIPNAPGDVNADGAIDEDDVRGIAGFIVNKPLRNCSSIAADIDSDGIINIIDCVKEVNSILK